MSPDDRFRIGYSGALQMVSTQATAFWTSFYSISQCNAFLLALVGVLLTQGNQKYAWASIPISVLGVIGCGLWILNMSRHFQFYAYYMAWAREAERAGTAPEIRMLNDGEKLARGDEVTLPNGEALSLTWFARVRIVPLAASVPALFFMAYCVTGIIAVQQISN